LDEGIFGGEGQGLGEWDRSEKLHAEACEDCGVFVISEEDPCEIR